MGRQAGVDAYRKGWIAIVLDDGSFAGAHIAASFDEMVKELTEVDVIAVDIPIGIGATYPRPADLAARKFVGRRRASVFLTPPRSVLEAPNYTEARQVARRDFGIGVSAQAYSLAPRILEVDRVTQHDPRIIEAHPEVSFRAMADNELPYPKTSWNGLKHRERLLEDQGIFLPRDLAIAGGSRPDDILDAAAAGWTALRSAARLAEWLPEAVQPSQTSAVWY